MMSMLLETLAKFFIYLAIASPLLVTRSLFFPFITGKVIFFRTAIELALLLFIILLLINRDYWQKIKVKIANPIFLTVSLYITIFIISTITAVNPQTAFWSNFERAEGGWQMLHYFFFFALITILFNTKKEWLNLVKWQLFIVFLVSLYALAQIITPSSPGIIAPGTVSGTLGNSSYLASFLIFGIFFSLWTFFNEKNAVIKYLAVFLIFLQIFLFFQAKTRAAIIAFAIGLMLFLLISLFKKSSSSRRFGLTILTLLITGATFFTIVQIKNDVTVIQGIQPRLWTWGSALAGFLEKPILGWGVENFPYVFDKYYNPNHYGIETWFDRTHNIFLEQLINGGIFLFLAYLFIFYSFYKLLLSLPRNNTWPLFFVLPVAYLINGLTLFEVLPLYLPLFLFFALFINTSLNFPELKNPQPQPLNTPRWLIFYLALIIITFSFYYTLYLPLQKNKLLVQGIMIEDKTPQEILNNLEKALSFPSPVGQQEVNQQLLAFAYDLLSWFEKKPLDEERLRDIDTIIKFNLDWFNKNRDQFIGVKNSYLVAEILMGAAELTKDDKYLAQAKNFINQEIKLAPTRLEFLIPLAQIATREKDEATLRKMEAIIKKVRPDLDNQLKLLYSPKLG